MLLIPILLSLGVVRLAISLITAEEKSGHPRTFRQFTKALSVALLGIGTILLSASYEDEEIDRALRYSLLLIFLAIRLIQSLLLPAFRLLAFWFFVKAILTGLNVFDHCDELERAHLGVNDLAMMMRGEGDLRLGGKACRSDFVEASTIITSDSERTLPPNQDLSFPSSTSGFAIKPPVTQSLTVRHPSDPTGAIQSKIIIQLTVDSGLNLPEPILAQLDNVISETLAALIPSTLQAMDSTHNLVVVKEDEGAVEARLIGL